MPASGAFPPQKQPAQHRNIFNGRDPVPALGTARPGNEEVESLRLILKFLRVRMKVLQIIPFEVTLHHHRHPVNNHIQKTADHKSDDEDIDVIKNRPVVIKEKDLIHGRYSQKRQNSIILVPLLFHCWHCSPCLEYQHFPLRVGMWQ